MMESVIDTKFKNILEPLKMDGWQFIKSQSDDRIIMSKKYQELEEINIEYKNSQYHFSLPLKNSIYCYYKKIADEEQSFRFLKTFVDDLIH